MARKQMVCMIDARALVSWAETKAQSFEVRRQWTKDKILNGKNCGKKPDRDQEMVTVILWTELGREPSAEARDVTAFARSYLFRHGARPRFKQIQKGSLIQGVMRLRVKAARRRVKAA